MAKKDELDILLPGDDITVKGEKIEIKPFPFFQLPKVVKAFNKVGIAFFSIIATARSEGDDLVFEDSSLFSAISVVMEEHFEDVIELMSYFCNKPAEWFKDEENGPNFEEGIVILIEIIRQNRDFFTKRLRLLTAQLTENPAKEIGRK